jgi:hypothetical protein
MRLTASYWWCTCDSGASRVCQITGTKDCGLLSRTEDFWEQFGGCPRGGTLNQSVSHRYLRLLILLAMRPLMMEVDKYLCLINCIAQLMLAIAC